MICLFLLLSLPWQALALDSWSERRINALEHKLEMLTTQFDAEIKNKNIEISDLQKRVQILEDENKYLLKASRIPDDEESFRSMNSNGPKHYKIENKTLEQRVEHLEDLSRIQVLRSCHEYQAFGITTSGLYNIDPDGSLVGHPPFEVFCNFEQGITEVLHDQDAKTIEIPECEEPKCFRLDLNYNAPMEQISALKEISDTCTQYIGFDCFLSGLSTLNHPIGTWLNINGDEEVYFTGSNHGNHICSCGVEENCSGSDSNYKCNCDNTIPILQSDNGTLTDVSALPITGFIYGEKPYPSQFAAISIGRLKCTGMKNIQPEDRMNSCSNLKLSGVSQSGNYVLNDQSISYCDMTKGTNDAEIQRFVGGLHVYKAAYDDVLFVAVSSTSNSVGENEYVIFDTEQIDNSNNFDTETGTFSVPKDGIYAFFFNCNYADAGVGKIQVYVNGEGKDLFDSENDDDSANDRQMSVFWSMELKANDELRLYNAYPSIYISDAYKIYFMGYKMN